MQPTNRNIGVDILKFVAILLIINCHMDILYVKFSFLSTGGAIGDALFFFCSGFTLFLKPIRSGLENFANWYKKRFNRIYPTVLATAIIKCTFFDGNSDINSIFIKGGGWFVTCIMIYYVAIYLIGCTKNVKKTIYIALGLTLVGSIIWFYLLDRPIDFNVYKSGNTLQGIDDPKEGGYLKWLIYFLYMLIGTFVGLKSKTIIPDGKKDLVMFIVSVILFYAFYLIPRKIYDLSYLQIFSCIPLIYVCYYMYKLCISNTAKKLFSGAKAYRFMRIVGGLCLESYLIQFVLFTDKMNSIFPLNLLIMLVIILIAAYLLRCFSRLILQSFREEPYDWRKIIDLM